MTSGKVPAKAFAVFAVALMMLSVLPMINVSAPEAEGYVGDTTTVTYHYGESSDVKAVVTYYGTPIAEYNPQYWNDSFAGEVNTGLSTLDSKKWKPEKGTTEYTVHLTIGWSGSSFTAGNCVIGFDDWNIVTIDALCETLWEGPLVGYENTLMVHIRRLREKIEADPSHPCYLLTVRGLGYRLSRGQRP